MRIEPCEYQDLPIDLVRQARREGADLDQTLKSRWIIWRACWGIETVGFVGTLLRSPSTATIRGWYVRPLFRGQGIGTALMEHAIVSAIQEGARKVDIRTSKDRIAHRFGFEWTGYQRRGGKQERHFVRHFS